MRINELAKLGFHPSVLRYPYRVKTKNGKVKLVYDPTKGLGKLKEAMIGSRGEANEIFQAIALYLIFKDKTVDAGKIESFVMNTVAPKSPNINIQSRPNEKGDTFRLQLPIPTSLQTTLFDPKNYQAGGLYVGMPSKVEQLTKKEYTKQVAFIHDNNRKDAVDIAVVGGKGGKVDVSGQVTFTDAKGKQKTQPLKNMQISLKIDTDRFDQFSGKKMVESFQRAFGIDTVSIANQAGLTQALTKVNPLMLQITKSKRKNLSDDQANKVLANIEKVVYGNGDGPMYQFFRTIASSLNKQLAGKQGEKKERKILADTLGNVISKGIGEVTMINFEKDGYSILDQAAIQNLSNAMKTTDLNVKYEIKGKKKGDKARPYLEFYDTKDNEMFFFVRNAMDKYATIRNFVQSGKKFNQFKRFVKYDK